MVVEVTGPQRRGRGGRCIHKVHFDADRGDACCGCGAVQNAGFADRGGLAGDNRLGLDVKGRGAFCYCDGGTGEL